MGKMFENCESLESLNFSSSEIIKVNNVESMFSQCYSLTSLNLNSFRTNEVQNMEKMFSKCFSLSNTLHTYAKALDCGIFSKVIFFSVYPKLRKKGHNNV